MKELLDTYSITKLDENKKSEIISKLKEFNSKI
jgi:hypothetical protein